MRRLLTWTSWQAVLGCSLQSLQLRSKDQAVDVHPAFSPEVYSYAALLDFSMEEFSIDAQPAEGCEISGLPNRPFLAPAGQREGEDNTKESNLCARDPKSGKEQWYRISVSKLSGTETQVLALQVRGAQLEPKFEAATRSYKAQLGVAHDFIEVDYVLLDNGQRVGFKASPEQRGELQNASRRLSSGEQQHQRRHEVFLVDPGHVRKITMTIESADPMQAARGIYSLEVSRDSCGERRPFFDPRTHSCTLECPQGTYPDKEAMRCSFCNRHCAVCQSLTVCDLCEQASIHRSYILDKGDGSCREVRRSFFAEYYWWCLSGATAGALLLCLMLASICQCLCNRCSPRRNRHFNNSDSDWD